MLIRVECGKGRKDCMLSAKLLKELRHYYKMYHPDRGFDVRSVCREGGKR